MSRHSNDGEAPVHMDDRDVLEKAHVTHEEAAAIAQLTPEEKVIEKRLRRKVDARILPVAVAVYIMNYIDRNNYASARLQGLQSDLNLTDTQYQTGKHTIKVI